MVLCKLRGVSCVLANWMYCQINFHADLSHNIEPSKIESQEEKGMREDKYFRKYKGFWIQAPEKTTAKAAFKFHCSGLRSHECLKMTDKD